MVFTRLREVSSQVRLSQVGLEGREIRALVAKYLDIDIGRVTDEAHFRLDLGADWLARLELLMLMEDELGDVEITDDEAEQIELVGDLIRCVADARSRARIAPAARQ